MYYELYVDVLFLVNFSMDYLLLLLVKKMLKCSATHGRLFLGAIAGALLTCVIVILPIPYTLIKLVLFHMLVNTCMIRVGLKIKNIRTFIKAMFLLYIGAFLMGGVIGAVRQYIRVGSLFLFVAIAGYYTVLGIWKFISGMQRFQQNIYEVEIHFGEKVWHIKGLLDTGNQLSDVVSGKPVSILDRRCAKELFGEIQIKNMRFIPYRTIGEKERVLAVITVDKLQICGEKECLIENALIGISESEITSGGEYEMILNQNLF